MSSDFNLRDLVAPGVASMFALEREIERRMMVNRAKPGYLYSGAAELLHQHGKKWHGARRPPQYTDLQGPMSRCYLNALEFCEAHPELRYFEGVYLAGTSVHHHGWCVTPDDQIVEVTLEEDYEPGMVLRHGSSRVPWVAPEGRAYIGVEYDTTFVRAYFDWQGLPLLDPQDLQGGCTVPENDDRVFRLPYAKLGFPLGGP